MTAAIDTDYLAGDEVVADEAETCLDNGVGAAYTAQRQCLRQACA